LKPLLVGLLFLVQHNFFSHVCSNRSLGRLSTLSHRWPFRFDQSALKYLVHMMLLANLFRHWSQRNFPSYQSSLKGWWQY